MKSDANKSITLIEYNYLKLPKRVVKGGITVLNEYNSSGKKLKETVGTVTTDFLGNLIYKNDVLYQIEHEEGRIINGEYEYNINDHLGNLRISFRDSSGVAKITQRQDYDPYGSQLQGINYLKSAWNKNEFKYNGKEFIEETGLNDLGWRQQDPVLGRMWASDRFAEEYYGLSNYQFAGNNPIKYIDINGDSITVSNNILNDNTLNQAFMAFANTGVGYSFLSQFAKKGQSFGNVKFNADGKYHQNKINLNYSARVDNTSPADGTTKHTSDLQIKYFKPEYVDINININLDGDMRYYQSKDVFGLSEVFFHESFIHADLSAEDYIKDGKFNFSNLPNNDYVNSADDTHKQHAAVSQAYSNVGSKTPYKFGGDKVFRGLQEAAKLLNVNYSNELILKKMWNFSGGLKMDNNGKIMR